MDADFVTVSGLTPKFVASSINTPTLGGIGYAGNLTVNTKKLTISDGGFVIASSVGNGNAGKLTINASTSIDIIGNSNLDSTVYQSGIVSAVDYPREP